MSVPARFREALAQKFEGDMHLVVVPNERCLEVHPLSQWEAVEARVRENSMFDERTRDFGRLYVSRARDVETDTAGRILLPPDSRQYAGLDREVTLVGGGGPFFEVWDRKRFEEYERAEQHRLPDLFGAMATRGV